MKNETQSALVARDAAIILLLIWAFMQALLMIWAPADTQTTYLLLLFLMDIAVLCGFMDRVNTGTALAATITCGWVAYKLYSFYAVGETVHLTDYFVTVLPLLGSGAAALFSRSMRHVNAENKLLRRQVDEQVLPFISLMNPDGAESVVAVSDAADEAELTAAMMLMAGMGNSLSAQNAMTLCRLSDAKSENVLYVGLKKNTPEHLLSLLTQSVPATGALVQRVTDGDTSYLLIVAEEEAALSEAAALLSDTSRVAQLHTSQTYVSVGEAQQYALASETSGLTLAGQYTIKDISGNGISFSGPFTQKMTIYLPVAKDYVLSSESRFSFDIRYSENLDFDRSLVTFYWGTNIPLYSHKLTKEGATGETLTFSVPADAIGEAGSSITVVFDLEIKDLDCTVRSMNTPWAYIAANSSLYLPAGENTTLNLANLPAPFQRASRMNNVVMILSDDATQMELTLAGRIMAMLGAGSTPYGLLKVIRAENFQAAAHGNSNLIVVGLSDRNSVLKQINPYLHFQYTDDMTSLAESTKLVMTTDYAHEASVLQLMKSPYNETMALLTASAATEAGLQNLMARLSTEKNRWSLGKEALVVDGYGGASSYQFTVSTALTQNAEKPSFADVIVQNREPMTLLLVGMGCMLVLLLAAVLLLVRIHHRRKYDDK